MIIINGEFFFGGCKSIGKKPKVEGIQINCKIVLFVIIGNNLEEKTNTH
jgi:hypothetical protein